MTTQTHTQHHQQTTTLPSKRRTPRLIKIKTKQPFNGRLSAKVETLGNSTLSSAPDAATTSSSPKSLMSTSIAASVSSIDDYVTHQPTRNLEFGTRRSQVPPTTTTTTAATISQSNSTHTPASVASSSQDNIGKSNQEENTNNEAATVALSRPLQITSSSVSQSRDATGLSLSSTGVASESSTWQLPQTPRTPRMQMQTQTSSSAAENSQQDTTRAADEQAKSTNEEPDFKISTGKSKAHLSCDSGEMALKLDFSEPFKGIIYPDQSRQWSQCRVFGDGRLSYELKFPLKGCGTRQPAPRVFVTDVFVRFHKSLELEEDEIKTLICRYPPPVTPKLSQHHQPSLQTNSTSTTLNTNNGYSNGFTSRPQNMTTSFVNATLPVNPLDFLVPTDNNNNFNKSFHYPNAIGSSSSSSTNPDLEHEDQILPTLFSHVRPNNLQINSTLANKDFNSVTQAPNNYFTFMSPSSNYFQSNKTHYTKPQANDNDELRDTILFNDTNSHLTQNSKTPNPNNSHLPLKNPFESPNSDLASPSLPILTNNLPVDILYDPKANSDNNNFDASTQSLIHLQQHQANNRLRSPLFDKPTSIELLFIISTVLFVVFLSFGLVASYLFVVQRRRRLRRPQSAASILRRRPPPSSTALPVSIHHQQTTVPRHMSSDSVLRHHNQLASMGVVVDPLMQPKQRHFVVGSQIQPSSDGQSSPESGSMSAKNLLLSTGQYQPQMANYYNPNPNQNPNSNPSQTWIQTPSGQFVASPQQVWQPQGNYRLKYPQQTINDGKKSSSQRHFYNHDTLNGRIACRHELHLVPSQVISAATLGRRQTYATNANNFNQATLPRKHGRNEYYFDYKSGNRAMDKNIDGRKVVMGVASAMGGAPRHDKDSNLATNNHARQYKLDGIDNAGFSMSASTQSLQRPKQLPLHIARYDELEELSLGQHQKLKSSRSSRKVQGQTQKTLDSDLDEDFDIDDEYISRNQNKCTSRLRRESSFSGADVVANERLKILETRRRASKRIADEASREAASRRIGKQTDISQNSFDCCFDSSSITSESSNDLTTKGIEAKDSKSKIILKNIEDSYVTRYTEVFAQEFFESNDREDKSNIEVAINKKDNSSSPGADDKTNDFEEQTNNEQDKRSSTAEDAVASLTELEVNDFSKSKQLPISSDTTQVIRQSLVDKIFNIQQQVVRDMNVLSSSIKNDTINNNDKPKPSSTRTNNKTLSDQSKLEASSQEKSAKIKLESPDLILSPDYDFENTNDSQDFVSTSHTGSKQTSYV